MGKEKTILFLYDIYETLNMLLISHYEMQKERKQKLREKNYIWKLYL